MPQVSIIIPVLNKLHFTRQCLDRLWRETGDAVSYEVIVVDNGSTDDTAAFFSDASRFPRPVRYIRNDRNLGFARANNIGARLSTADYLLFLNNDTLARPGWLDGMVRVARSSRAVGIVGIKQLFPYTNLLYHTGIVFAPGGIPQHLYPHLDADMPWVNKEREYQAVTGACLLIGRTLFEECGGFDEDYLNGYEDVDLCLTARQRGRTVVCCTSSFIYHYGQISEGRTDDDDANAARFARKWAGRLAIDRDDYLARDRADVARWQTPAVAVKQLAADCIYLADDLSQGSALTWINAELALSLAAIDVPVMLNGKSLSTTLPAEVSKRLGPLLRRDRPVGGVQIKWSHYWPQHLNLELAGDVNLEFFVINYLFSRPGLDPWDYWLQCPRQNGYGKLPLSEFCQAVLQQIGVPAAACHIIHPGYSREVHDVEAPPRRTSSFRLLTVTNSHDLERYGTMTVLDAYDRAFGPTDDVTLVVKDYGASSGSTAIRERLARRTRGAAIEYVTEFTDKAALIRLYKSCDAYVSGHRGEGYGLKILDAMACGLPVITPLFGGPTSYCAPETCVPVAFDLVPVGDCLDTRSLTITNHPVWAEVQQTDLVRAMRDVWSDRPAAAALGARGRASVIERFTWDRAARTLADVTSSLGAAQRSVRRRDVAPVPKAERSPYWLGLRISVVIPTFNRRQKLARCLDALAVQSILPHEFEVIVIDDGSEDGTDEEVGRRSDPFRLRYLRQPNQGPGAARNLGIEQADGELVLFIGDDIIADQCLLERHLLTHANRPQHGDAVLGHIDWPAAMTPNAVMEYVCGDAALQFAYTLIPHLSTLDHRFFYTSNISLKRQFLVDAATSGIRFDPAFHRAAFEDSEFAYRLMPRGLRIHYAAEARVWHDHWMDLESFVRREAGAGEMAVVYYRKHPGHDDQLLVRWLADLPSALDAIAERPDLKMHLESFDTQTDRLLRATAASLEGLLAIEARTSGSGEIADAARRSRQALHNVLRTIFDVERTRGKVREWFANVDDPRRVALAQLVATVRRKVDFLGGAESGALGALPPLDPGLAQHLRSQIAGPDPSTHPAASAGQRGPIGRGLRRIMVSPAVVRRLLALDRYLQSRLSTGRAGAWGARYRRLRGRLRKLLVRG